MTPNKKERDNSKVQLTHQLVDSVNLSYTLFEIEIEPDIYVFLRNQILAVSVKDSL
jgi:hypothetical protein